LAAAAPSSSSSGESLSRAIAASARAAALSSQLRAAHKALLQQQQPLPLQGSSDPSALSLVVVATISALADAAAETQSALSTGARAGSCEFFAYVLPASPFLPAWREAARRALPAMPRAALSAAFSALGRLPFYPPAPLPIGFGTPRYARPLAAAEPEEWERLLDEAAEAWLRLPPPPPLAAAAGEEENKQEEEEEEEEEEEARFLLGLALARRWAGERVGDAWLASREAEEALGRALGELPAAAEGGGGSARGLSRAARLAAALLQVRGAPPAQLARALFAETAAAAPGGGAANEPWPAGWGGGTTASAADAGGDTTAAEGAAAPEAEQQQQQQQLPPSTLLRQLLHAQPPAPPASPPPSALCSRLSPRQVQRVARGLVYLAAVPPDPWLAALAAAARCALGGSGGTGGGGQQEGGGEGAGALSRAELGALRDALKFFLSTRRAGAGGREGGAAWSWRAAGGGGGAAGRGEDGGTGLADAVALLDEWRVGGSGAF
jgi:hypothetical protein